MKPNFCAGLRPWGLGWLMAQALQAQAAVTMLDYWRMGENDPGAAARMNCTNTYDATGVVTLTNAYKSVGFGLIFYPYYVTNIAAKAAGTTGSRFSIQYGPQEYGAGPVIPNLTDNFGLELWVNAEGASDPQCVAYNGNTGGSGWGLYLYGGSYQVLFGGEAFVCSAPASTNRWMHVALVRDNGVTTLYTNGVAASSSSRYAPNSPAGNFLVAANNSGSEPFTGMIDEMRVFTFAPGQFSTNDLLLNDSFHLGTTNLLEGPMAGGDSVVVSASTPGVAWTAAANAGWLHLLNASGTGSTNVGFRFDPNIGATRSGTLTIHGQTVTVTQAGSTYTAAGAVTLAAGLLVPQGVAADRAGNVYIVTSATSSVQKWDAASNSLSTLISLGFGSLNGIAVDALGNVYLANVAGSVVKWTASTGSSAVIISGLLNPQDVAVDASGNLYIAAANKIIQRVAATGAMNDLVSAGAPTRGVAVGIAGNVYFCYDSSLGEWSAANSNTTVLVNSSLSVPQKVAVDGAGNLNFTELGALKRWTWESQVTNIRISGIANPHGVAVDGTGNVFFVDNVTGNFYEAPNAFLDLSAQFKTALAGNGALPPVVPATANLTGPFQPASSQSWLTITGVTNGVVSYAFTANTNASNRTATITMLGQSVPVTQFSALTLGVTSLAEGPAAGTDSVLLAAGTATNGWTAAANTTWLHVAAGSQSGVGSTNIIFSFDANPGVTRTGAITIGNQTLTLTQAGATYVAAGTLTSLPLVISADSVGQVGGLAVDGAGNVYAPDFYAGAIKKWQPGNFQTTSISNNFAGSPVEPESVAVDAAGNLYIVDGNNNNIEKWSALTGNLTVLASPSGIGVPDQIAVDNAGNVYYTRGSSSVVEKWTAASNSFAPLISGLNNPEGLAVDAAGNIYVAESGNNRILKANAAGGDLTPLVTGLNQPQGLAVDGSGNVYIAETGNNAIKKWTAATGDLNTLATNLSAPNGVGVDAQGNVYTADSTISPARKLPRAFVDPSSRSERQYAGSDSLPPVLPVDESLLYPLQPIYFFNDLPLTLNSANNGVVNFSFPANNAGMILTSGYTVLGQFISIRQDWVIPPRLTDPVALPGGGFQFDFTNNQGATFSVLASTNVAAPLTNWTIVGPATNLGGGLFQFALPAGTNAPQQFFRVSSP